MIKMKTNIFTAAVMVLVFLYPVETLSEEQDFEVEIISDLILDRAITVQGHEFYKYFSQTFVKPRGVAPATLVIKELPSARWGSLIWVESESKVLYGTQLRPGRGNVKEEAENAAKAVSESLFRIALNGVIEEEDLDKNGY